MAEHVEIVAFDHDNGTQRLVAVISLVEGRADVDVHDELFDDGVPQELQDPSTGVWVTRESGSAFLELLPYRFHGSYLVATPPHVCGASECLREVASA